MNNQLEKATKQISKAFDKHIKDSNIGAFFIGVTDESISFAYNGTPEEKYNAIAHFLFEHPDHIGIFEASVNCAKDYQSKKETLISQKQFLN